MKTVLYFLIINHLIYLAFGVFIVGITSDPQTADTASGFGMIYALVVFPIQLLAEIALIGAFIYQLLIVRNWRATPVLWVSFVVTVLSLANV